MNDSACMPADRVQVADQRLNLYFELRATRPKNKGDKQN